jgi:hypothetical protein
LPQRVGTELLDFFREQSYKLRKAWRFSRRAPLQGKSIGIDSRSFKRNLDGFNPGKCFVITIQVMTFTQMSAHDDDTVGSFSKGVHHQIRRDHTGAHDADGPHVRWILKPGNARKIAACISAPVAKISNDDWFEIGLHGTSSLDSSLYATV